MNFDLMTGRYRTCVKEIKIHSVETEWNKSEVKRENHDLCKTKNVMKR